MSSSGKFAKSEKLLLMLAVLYCVSLLGIPARDHSDDAVGYRITVEHPQARAETETDSQSVRIDLNSATAAELQKLPGIGEKLADRIIAYRTEHGSFQTTEEIMEVRGIGEGIYENLKELITVDGAVSP